MQDTKSTYKTSCVYTHYSEISEREIKKTILSERKNQIPYINAYMWNLEKWYRGTGLQGRTRDTDVENQCMDTKGGKQRGRGGEMNWEIEIDIYTLISIK